MPLIFQHSTYILDASCIITLYASQQIKSILHSIPSTVAVATYVFEREALWFYDGSRVNVRASRAIIDLDPLVSNGLLKMVTLNSEEEKEQYATFAQKLDPGEAITGAIAVQRNWGIILDERKARNHLQREASHLQQLYALDLIKHWADMTRQTTESIMEVLWDVRYRGSYLIKSHHPLHEWWSQYYSDEI